MIPLAATAERAWGRTRRVLARGLFLLVALVSVLLLVYVVLDLAAGASSPRDPMTWIQIGLIGLDAVGCLAIVVYDFTLANRGARLVARLTVGAVIAALVLDLARHGVQATQLFFLLQIALIVGFQTATDAELRRGHRLAAPWEISEDPTRARCIPLNFFNLFWVFAVASLVGLLVELLWHLLKTGQYEDRAGLLWGPFSPIYGFGALLMTIALNRWWNSSKLVVLLVSGVIGASFEFAVSWWLEKAFGIVAWDYSGTFLNIDGRTNFAYFCAWGVLGLVWIRLLLPDLLQLVDRIPLRWRAVATILAALVLLIDGAMTLLVLDRWHARDEGEAPTGAITRYIDAHYDDAFMKERFQTMDFGSVAGDTAQSE
ncbi:putative ABC transporter permease [Actinomyces culturomici]|uniref:putative ABC transporter permease n=1 Tax=Actinomyces culturomici TaxID=1926276 RepID=UPI000E20482A|nr:putative ABC transporter permease [Actinomyces culturomici]